jgi:hypothetical protein
MDTVYWDEQKMKFDGANASILAIGDSWFWYPFPGGSLASHLGPIVGKKEHVIFAKGMNGAEVADYVGKYAKGINSALRIYGKDLSAVFISGGGNDFAGFNDLRPLLKADCSAETNAKGCFQTGANGLAGFFDAVEDAYRRLIGIIYTYTDPDCLIVMHTYDYAIPDGRGVFGQAGWLKPALVAASVKTALHEECMKYLLDAFYDRLRRIIKMDPRHLIIVDSRGTLAAKDWANELHPTGKGFAKIANEKWKPTLAALNLA